MSEMYNIIRKYVGKKEETTNCVVLIKEILEGAGIKIDVCIDDIYKDYEEVIEILNSIGRQVDKPKKGDIIVIMNDDETAHFGLFIDDYRRFFHIHNGVGMIFPLYALKKDRMFCFFEVKS